MSEYCENCYKLQAQYDKVVEQNRQLQSELREKTAECEELKNKLNNENTAYENEIEIFNQTCLDLQEELQESISECEELKIKLMQKDEEYCNKFGQNSIGFRKNILDIIKRTGGQRVKAERTRLMPARPRRKAKDGKNDK